VQVGKGGAVGGEKNKKCRQSQARELYSPLRKGETKEEGIF